jgi:hypothetical protein
MNTIIQQIRSSLCNEFEKLFRERVSLFNKNLSKISNLSIQEIDKCWELNIPFNVQEVDPDLILPHEESSENGDGDDSEEVSEKVPLPGYLFPSISEASKKPSIPIDLPPTQDFEEDIFEVIEKEKTLPLKQINPLPSLPKPNKLESKTRTLPSFIKNNEAKKEPKKEESPVTKKKEIENKEVKEEEGCQVILKTGARKGEICGRIKCRFHR